MSLLEEIPLQCPCCGQSISVLVDCTESDQQYVEDCQVCCAPMLLTVWLDEQGEPHLQAKPENG
ncbi:CPXCG motif-containing cysteine-rich protein [Marinobacterium arenosum]|uniref:CPXCG motif-containing cysteine-rich protein n=1 Tax=Marinobacterium arenosum TaxID=2862496 RepID=UPI001C9893F3|nr:CPXCG motif-containing cysteine-rich protein [Marinobacterium arenosum]MBY4677937.1 CPXCG motif-containing cysteine-rich protein [Marinobacterium arenosum]